MCRNLFLSALPGEYRQKLSSSLERVDLALGDIVSIAGRPVQYVFFPETALFSTVVLSDDGDSVEAGLAGMEGAVCALDAIGSGECTATCLIQGAGSSYRMDAGRFAEEWEHEPIFRNRTMLYAQYLFSQICQTAMCNRIHSMDKRLSRWLLMCCDAVQTDDLQLTQEFIATMLGVNRPGVSIAAQGLQESGLIHYSRGRIRVLNRLGLASMACECYAICRARLDQLAGS